VFFTFNDNNQIQTLDLDIHNLGKAVNGFFADQTSEIERVCGILFSVAGCNEADDPLGFYETPEDCIAFLSSVDYGSWDDLRTNSVACRQFHAVLAIARPQVHCPHAGRTGGGKCINVPYTDYYLQQY